jgi:hypothetical protein
MNNTKPKHSRSHSARLRQSQHLRQSQYLKPSQKTLRTTAKVRYAKNLQSVNLNIKPVINVKPKKYRFNINLQNKNIKLLKRPIPIIPVRKQLEQLDLYFEQVIEHNYELFYYEYSFDSYDMNQIQKLLHKMYETIQLIIDKIKKIMLNNEIVNPDTSIYNYYVTNFDNLQNEIFKNFTEINATNGRTLRFQLKQIKSFIHSYIENILN